VGAWLDAAPEPREAVDPTLAREGGRPVRTTPFPTKMLGADLTGLAELRRLHEAVATKTLFRHYGAGTPVMAETLERSVRERFGCRYALGVTSGSAALLCAMAALDLQPGDEVILPGFSWFSCYNAIVLHGGTPVFCGVDRTLNLDPEDAAERITPRTRALLVVHYQGGAARLPEILALAGQHGLRVVEDCAQAMGAQLGGRYLGTLGDLGTFSFQGNKIVCAGEGGMVTTNDPVLFERAVRYHDLGHVRPTFEAQLGHPPVLEQFPGAQFRLGEPAAAVALAQFEKLPWMLGRCRLLSAQIREQVLAAAPHLRFRLSPDPEGDAGITLFWDLDTPKRAGAVSAALEAEGMPLGPSSGMCNLLHEAYIQKYGAAHQPERAADWPALSEATDARVDSVVAIGIGPRYTRADAEDIAQAIIKVTKGLSV
jgi:8-amino-3,8-dideoxy-alpha-D-manno-octulosonate transaminase